MYRIQILHPESGLYLNTNHESYDLDELKSLLNLPSFAGPSYQIVDGNGVVLYGPVAVKRDAPISVEDLAQSFGVPILDPEDFDFPY